MKVSEDQNTVTTDDGTVHAFDEGLGHCHTCTLVNEHCPVGCDLLCQSMYRDDGKNGNFQLREVNTCK